MGVPYSIFCCFKSTTETRLIDLEAGGGGGGTYSTDVNTMLASANNAAIRSAIGVGTTDAPTFLAQTLTGQSLTGTQATSLVDLATTWDTTGTPTGIKLDVTNTNSNPAALLMDLQVDGLSKFNVAKGGGFSFRAGATFGDISTDGAGRILLNPSGSNGVRVSGDLHIGTADVVLIQDAPAILAQRNGTAKQALRVYNTALSGAPEWAEFDWITSGIGNTLRIGTNLSGTGVARPIEFVVGGVVRMSIAAAGNVSIAGTFNFGSSNGVLPGGTNYGGHIGTSPYFAIKGTSTVATAIYIQNGSSGDKTGWVRVLGSGSVNHGALEVGALDSSPVIFTTALTERMRLSAAGNLGIGTIAPASKLTITSGDIEVDTVTNGIILKAAGTSTRYRITLNAGGTALVFTAV